MQKLIHERAVYKIFQHNKIYRKYSQLYFLKEDYIVWIQGS